jgi:hypothetical protein
MTRVSISAGVDVIEKRVQLLQQVVPQATRFWILPSRATRDRWQAEQRESARMRGVTYVGLPLDRPIDN